MVLKNQRFRVKLTAALLLSASFLACEDKPKEEVVAENSAFPRSETLYLGGFDWNPPSTFNPLDYDPNFPIDFNMRLMYETLVTYNQLDGKLEPLLAESFTQNEEEIIVHLNANAKWNNGTPVTVDDVLFTFKIDSLLPTPRHGNWEYLESVQANGLDIHFKYNKANKNPLIILNAIAETSILPKAVFEPLVQSAQKGKDFDYSIITAFKNDSVPLVSGPYNLKEFSPDKIVLERNSTYWGLSKYGNKLPAPKYIIHSVYEGNNHFNNAMTKGYLDVSSIFLPRIWDKKKDSIRAWSTAEPYHIPGSITTLLIAHEQEPFNDVAFRYALSHSIDFKKIKTRAVSNYTPTMQAGFILPFGAESKFYKKDAYNPKEGTFDVEEAKRILTEAGYSWDANGALLDKKGKPVRTITVECPSGWTDFEDIIKVVIGSFKEVGISAQEKFVDYSVWDGNLRKGTFDLSIKTQNAELSSATPWARFDQMMGAVAYRPIGTDAFANQGRYKNEAADKLIAKIPSITDEAELIQAYTELNKIFIETIPAIPLMYRPTQFYQFSTKHWTNFPTEENPYAPPHLIAAGIKALWEIKPNK